MTNDKHDRDATVGRLLAGAMSRGSQDPAGGPVPPKLVFRGPSEGGCLDADTLAAWADDALDGGARSAAEAHAADCARCQAMLAAMVKTAPATPAAAAGSWRMLPARWLVPLGAAAAVVIAWTIVPLRDAGPVNVRQVSQSAESTSQPPSPTQPPSAAADGVASLPAPAVNEERARREQPAPAEAKDVDLSRRSAAGAKADSAIAAAAEADKNKTASADLDLSRRSADAKADAPARRADLSRRSAEGAKADARLEKMQSAAEGAAASPPAAAPAPAAKTFSFGAPNTVIVSSNPASRWRLLQGGAVQRSADGGATWQTQNTGVSETLSAGASPSPSVCWLVGPRGIVLLSTDGRSWKRVASPEAVPLVAVRATDDQTATVTTADGREFVTEDGGRTWSRAPGL